LQPDRQSHLDEAVTTWDENPQRAQRARAVAGAVREAVAIGPGMSAVEIGCGTGLVTLALCDDLADILALDTSAEAVATLRDRLRELGVGNVEVLQLDLCTTEPPVGDVDLVFSSMALHHVDDPALMVRRAADLLRPGGALCVADLDAEDGSFHSGSEAVKHFGFSAELMQALFSEAGLVGMSTREVFAMERAEAEGGPRRYPVLMTIGGKPDRP